MKDKERKRAERAIQERVSMGRILGESMGGSWVSLWADLG